MVGVSDACKIVSCLCDFTDEGFDRLWCSASVALSGHLGSVIAGLLPGIQVLLVFAYIRIIVRYNYIPDYSISISISCKSDSVGTKSLFWT